MNAVQMKTYYGAISNYYFKIEQKEVIKAGVIRGIDVSWYARPEFDWLQMAQIRYGLENNVDVSIYTKPDFNYIVTKNHNK